MSNRINYENLIIGQVDQTTKIEGNNIHNFNKTRSCQTKWCKIEFLLVAMQFALAVGLIAIGLFLQTVSSSILLRDASYWTGIPLLLASLCGIFYCITETAKFKHTVKSCLAKFLSTSTSFLCSLATIVASVYSGLHGGRIAKYKGCVLIKNTCICNYPQNSYEYENVTGCDVIITSVKDYLILESALNALASCVCLWICGLIWKRRYGNFNSGPI
ncbi:DgyrCDS4536 [Dimorphilus gyrociliatus]|uniref:DgyrCDS4536 n=1 Tax=Dimorphilus gyrociliatus TaxID=2664684 RepID=A0A7I8VIQ1_9ANNE|nr:DgyrCDS4536 [Dimorphilus gyrociliatus]